MIELLKKNSKNIPLISFGDKTLSQFDFTEKVKEAKNVICNSTELDRENFVLLDSKNPVTLYSLMFSMIFEGYRVLLPNRDFFTQKDDSIDFASQIVSYRNGKIAVIDNSSFVEVVVPEGNFIVFSSGSTGKPKGIVHYFSSFLQNAVSVARKIGIKDTVNLTWLPPYLVSAISHFLVHWLSDSHLVFDDFQNLNKLPEIASGFPSLGVVGSPVHITNAVSILPTDHNSSMFFSSGDVISRNAINTLLHKFPSTVFYYVYGLAELGGRFFINTVTKQSTLPVDCIGQPIEGCTPIIEDGKVFVKSDYSFIGYIIDSTFIPAQEKHDTGDTATVESGNIYLKGRSNDEVKVLGNKINIKYIETRAKNALNTDDLVLVATKNEKFGNLIVMVIKKTLYSRAQIMKRLRGHLESYEMPHLYYNIEEFPFTQSMKVDRKVIGTNLDHYQKLL